MDPEAMGRQNAERIALDAAWLQTAGWVSDGARAGKGQNANYFHAIPRVLQRG